MSEGLVVAVSSDGVRSPVSAARLGDAARLTLRAEGIRDALVSIALVANSRIARLNWRHLHHRGPTDVLAFGFVRERPEAIVADIYIAPDVARANARRLRALVREEILRLVVHGVLHVVGYDHPAGESRERSAMWRRQEALLARALRRPAA